MTAPGHRKARGMQTQRIAAERLRPWFPYATPRGAGEAGTDLLHTPGFAIEIKATSRDPLQAALRQAAANAAPGELPVVLWRPNGLGPERAGEWVAALTLDTLTRVIGLLQDGRDTA